MATWLVSKFGIVNHALRDTFTAGGQVDIDGVSLPKIFNHLFNDIDDITSIVKTIPEDDISYYWEIDVPFEDSVVTQWGKQCLRHCKENLDNRQYKQVSRLMKNAKNT